MENVSVVSGQMEYRLLVSPEDKNHHLLKARIWVNLINDGMRPVKWLKSTKKGTKVNFVPITSDIQMNEAYDEFDTYLKMVNETYGTEMKLTRPEKKVDLTTAYPTKK
ncbi:hypothetical protein C0431_12905 [bacterium]|nr:hypothetical protein [bacterium]